MPPVIICDKVTVGDTVILDPGRWGSELNPNGTIIAILSPKNSLLKERVKWFNNDEYEQFLVVSTSKIDDYLLIILPHEHVYQFKGYEGDIFHYSETTFLNRRCVVTYSFFIEQINPVSLYSTDRISKLIMRETLMLPTRRERD